MPCTDRRLTNALINFDICAISFPPLKHANLKFPMVANSRQAVRIQEKRFMSLISGLLLAAPAADGYLGPAVAWFRCFEVKNARSSGSDRSRYAPMCRLQFGDPTGELRYS
jgi:hypothetical protein